jgi:hypothetical protein
MYRGVDRINSLVEINKTIEKMMKTGEKNTKALCITNAIG